MIETYFAKGTNELNNLSIILRFKYIFTENISGTKLENAKMPQHQNFRLHHFGEGNSNYLAGC